MNAEKGLKAVPSAQNIINDNSDRTISWKVKHRDGVERAIGCLQLFGYKSDVSVNAAPLAFYPSHIDLLNFTEYIRSGHILSNRTIYAYLLVRFDVKIVLHFKHPAKVMSLRRKTA